MREWQRESPTGTFRAQASRLVRGFFDIGSRPDTNADMQQFAVECVGQLGMRNRLVLRAYVALTEAFNNAVTPTCLRKREWLCPWDKWDCYIYQPLWDHEEDFILIVAALGGMSIDAARAELTGMPPRLVMNTVSATAKAVVDSQMQFLRQSPTATTEWIDTTTRLIRRDYSMSERKSKQVAALQWYLFSGNILLRRHWWGYKLELAEHSK
jgi:hypothetical protein